MKKYIGTLLFLVSVCGVSVSAQVNENTIQQSALSVAATYKLSSEDIAGYIISDNYTQKNGNSHVYLIQTVHGYEIFNAMLQLHYTADGKLAYSNSRFVENKYSKTNSSAPSIKVQKALEAACKEIGINPEKISARTHRAPSGNKYKYIIFDREIFRNPVLVALGYENVNGKLILAYKLIIEPKGTSDMFNIRVDAQTGKVLKINNRTVYCEIPNPTHPHNSMDEHCENIIPSPLKINAVATYNAFPLGVESPIHGNRQVMTGIENVTASPFGWHDVDGVTGEDFTITQGNNVHAYEDQANQDFPGYSPDGGNSLNFNYPLDLNQGPVQNMDAALTNLFVWNNFMHDVTYFYGFDEVSGNFQANNYNNGGAGEDYVHAEGFDGSGNNNANFGTPEDGQNPTMQMYLWYHEEGDVFTINSPAPIAGPYESGSAVFGPSVPAVPITGNLVLMNGNTGTASQGCGTITNAAAINGKIALVDRGNCTFVEKAINAQDAGAIAMVLINNQGGGPPTMGGNDNGLVTIPCISVSQANGNLIKAQLLNGPVNVSIGGVVEEIIYDCDFDNGIISHEYGHGISNRLTGGPQNVDCLGNDEQAGEGWSDFFSLIMTDSPTSTINDVRGIGNYASNEVASANGIRPYPYTLDMNINPLTYEDIDGLSIPHGVGSVWCTMIWDLYLNLVSVYGHSHNLYSHDGGNNIAIQLVMEGMRLQPCDPGFVDARDAILQADMSLYDGAHQCIIWKTFARRGLGFSADQGSSFNVGDENEAFDLPPSCTGSDVDFWATPTSACAGVTIQFQNLVFPAGSSFDWTFPGGTPGNSTDPAPTVTYAAAGNYPVTLAATNINGSEVITKQTYITITQNLQFTVNTTMAIGGNTGTATVTQVSGTGPYTYSWAGFPAVTGATITGLAPGLYTVTVTDQSGCSSTEDFVITTNTSVDEAFIYSIKLFPNPVSDMLYINTTENKIIQSVRITDISGKQISNQILNTPNANLDISAFAAGMYLAHIEIDGHVLVKQFIKR